MKKIIVSFAVLLGAVLCSFAQDAKMISCKDAKGGVNEWTAFRKDIVLDEIPAQAMAKIAVDSKYWLWINGNIVVFEGGLKRGPNPTDSYYDLVDISGALQKGNNRIAVLVWHFGKSGFSHIDSGATQFLFDCPQIGLVSDESWLCRIHPAFGTCGDPQPNYRLSESNICFDANKDISWMERSVGAEQGFEPAVAVTSTLGELHLRPIPQWKDFGVKNAEWTVREGSVEDTLVARLPYNMQFTPLIAADDPVGGRRLKIQTDHVNGGSAPCVRAEYITCKGLQRFELYGWMNGDEIHVIVPKGFRITGLAYRETGYDMEPEGTFTCDDPFYNRFWKKALRTLYVNVRDTYYDCPDRERAQWWGDATLLMAESFYTYSLTSHQLARKAIHELAQWQHPDGVLSSPIPGNYKSELPAQMLASVGRYGFWNYYMNTGDVQTIKDVYPAVKKYLSLYDLDERGLTKQRAGGWNWGDWGDNKDISLIQAAWVYMACEAAAKMAELTGDTADIPAYKERMELIRNGFNNFCWDGKAYRHPEYKKLTDDRAQALAVVSGIAGPEKYDAIYNFLRDNEHASPYMEKYVMEALFQMGHGDYALERTKKRFSKMVETDEYTTLWEGWGIGREGGFGGGTVNHAWSGGAQIVIAQKLFGIVPTEAGWTRFSVKPVGGLFHQFSFSFPTVCGTVGLSCTEKNGKAEWEVIVPEGTSADVQLPGWKESRNLGGGNHRFVEKIAIFAQ